MTTGPLSIPMGSNSFTLNASRFQLRCIDQWTVKRQGVKKKRIKVYYVRKKKRKRKKKRYDRFGEKIILTDYKSNYDKINFYDTLRNGFHSIILRDGWKAKKKSTFLRGVKSFK